jgi:hypothetical protein
MPFCHFSRLQASTLRALSGRRGDLQLCLAALGGGDSRISQQQQRAGGSPSSAWQLGRGIPYPDTLPLTCGVNLRPSAGLKQLLDLEAGGAVAAEELEPAVDGDAAPPAAAVLPAAASAAAVATFPDSPPGCSFYLAEELNPLNLRPGVAPVAAASLESLSSAVSAEAGHSVVAVSAVTGHALAAVCAALPQGQLQQRSPENAVHNKGQAGGAIIVDARSVPTRTLVQDALSDALQRSLMLEDAVSAALPETVRQVS